MEVLVFWCFQCVEFCLSEIFQYKASCTIHGLNTQMLPQRNPNLKHLHKQHSDTLWETLQTPSSHHQKLKDVVRHQKTTTDTRKCHSMSTGAATHPWIAFWGAWGRLLVLFDVCWFLLVSVLVLICPEIPGGGDWEHMGNSVCMFMGFGCVYGVLKCSGLV